MAEAYLICLDDREHEAVRRLVADPYRTESIFEPFDLDAHFAWYFLRLKTSRLSEFEGDIDVLAGRLGCSDPGAYQGIVAEEARKWSPIILRNFVSRRLAEPGVLQWPPPTDYLIGIEAKCAYFSRRVQDLKATKASASKIRKMREEIERLLGLGMNRVALLDIIANPPTFSDLDGQAWLAAAAQADLSFKKFAPVLAQRLPAASPVGHYVCSWGAVDGKDETMRGAPLWYEMTRALENPHLQRKDVQDRHTRFASELRALLASVPPPKVLPAILFDCAKCGRIYSRDEQPCAH